ncbi:MAG: hypothetical protein DHS80DRAFT_28919 [Piptocephalis tieghemiana]|nr:MAG: hypothetical protein DHS80DRAFT_28919 [Piptocephalis tieghemiana]
MLSSIMESGKEAKSMASRPDGHTTYLLDGGGVRDPCIALTLSSQKPSPSPAMLRTTLSRSSRALLSVPRPAIPMSSYRQYTEGAIRAGNDTFSTKEKAVEDHFFHQQEVEKLKKLHDQLANMEKEVSASKDKVEKKIKEHESKSSK